MRSVGRSPSTSHRPDARGFPHVDGVAVAVFLPGSVPAFGRTAVARGCRCRGGVVVPSALLRNCRVRVPSWVCGKGTREGSVRERTLHVCWTVRCAALHLRKCIKNNTTATRWGPQRQQQATTAEKEPEEKEEAAKCRNEIISSPVNCFSRFLRPLHYRARCLFSCPTVHAEPRPPGMARLARNSCGTPACGLRARGRFWFCDDYFVRNRTTAAGGVLEVIWEIRQFLENNLYPVVTKRLHPQ
jgi:hypothetical protein